MFKEYTYAQYFLNSIPEKNIKKRTEYQLQVQRKPMNI